MVAARPLQSAIIQLPLPLFDRTAADVERLIGKLCYDDALVFRRYWRLEYLYLERGFPHYRLYRQGMIVGVVDIRAPTVLSGIQRRLGMYLAGCGCTKGNGHICIGGALTPLDAPKRDLPRLFPKTKVIEFMGDTEHVKSKTAKFNCN